MAEHWCKAAVESVVSNPAASVSAPPAAAPMTEAQRALQLQQQQYQQYYSQYSQYYGTTVAQPYAAPPVARPPPAPPQHTYSYPPPQAVPRPPAPVASAVASISARPGQTVLPTQSYAMAAARPPGSYAAAPPPPKAPAAAAGPGQWPPSLKKFVERAFSLCHSDVDRLFVSNKLRTQLSKVSAEGTLHSYNWDAEPTPDPRKKEEVVVAVPPVEKTKRKSRFAAVENKVNAPAVDTAATSYYGYAAQNSPQVFESPASKAGKKKPAGIVAAEVDDAALRKRQNRFSIAEDSGPQRKKQKKQVKGSAEVNYAALYNGNINQPSEFDVSKLTVVGTCRKIEKEYFRLTSAPDASTVRPEPILKQALALVKVKWEERSAEYVYLCSQLKAIRQDLTVQHICNDFTVDVYETHARIALQCQDLNEYNQCQTQLKHFYADKPGNSEMEFVAYRILYYVYLLGNKKYQRGSSDLADTMASLDAAALRNPAVVHALEVRRAVQSDNFVRFFKLYKETPNLGNFLLDLMLYSWRLQAAIKIVKSYKPSVELSFVSKLLGFTTADECEVFLKESGCQFIRSPAPDGSGDILYLDTKNSTSIASNSVVKQDQLLL